MVSQNLSLMFSSDIYEGCTIPESLWNQHIHLCQPRKLEAVIQKELAKTRSLKSFFMRPLGKITSYNSSPLS